MRNIIKVLVGFDVILISIPYLMYLLIKLEVDIYKIRTLVAENVLFIIVLFLTIAIVSYFIKNVKSAHKVLITLLSLGGIITYYLMFDTLLPY